MDQALSPAQRWRKSLSPERKEAYLASRRLRERGRKRPSRALPPEVLEHRQREQAALRGKRDAERLAARTPEQVAQAERRAALAAMTSEQRRADRNEYARKYQKGWRFTPAGRRNEMAKRTPERNRRKHVRARVSGKTREYERRARARQQGVPYTLTAEPPMPSTCAMCAEPFIAEVHVMQPTLDRVIPSLGYADGNVLWVHMACNAFKGQRSLEDAQQLLLNNPSSVKAAQLVRYLEKI